MDISERDILKILKEADKRSVSINEIINKLQIPAEKRSGFRKMVKRMHIESKIVRVKGSRYSLQKNRNLITGRIQAHPDGYAFLIPERTEEPDIYISPRNLRNAMHGDSVIIRIESMRRGEKREGIVLKVIKRAHTIVIGAYYLDGKAAYVIPEDRRIFQHFYIPKKNRSSAKKGQIVKGEITSYPTLRYNAEGKIIDILGYSDDPNVEIDIVVHKYNLPLKFPKKVLKEAEECPLQINPEEIKKRVDLRGLTTFTIDGETAKDFDDAVSIEKLKNGNIRLGVHIADVSYYVKENSEIDKEAFKRGTSVYFPDRAIPMLPERLSNGICSLNPMEERLTMSAIMDFDKKGNMRGYEILDTVIKSRERMTYTDVARILDGGKTLMKKYKGIKDELFLMKDLTEILGKRRLAEGSIDFDLPEADVILDMNGKIENIIKAERTIAHKMIEEFMLAANKTVASHLFWIEIPSLYRVHDKPDPLKIKEFNEFVRGFGYRIKGGVDIHPKSLQHILEKIKGRPEERLINTILLRSMKKARYSEENLGHFALAFDNYTHFTSPIRRYPDLTVHRLLRIARKKERLSKKRIKELEETLPKIAEQSSNMERSADEAEREIVDLKKAQFMLNKIGEEYFGYVSGVTPFGFFVELEDLFVEGLVHVTNLKDDYYLYLENQHMLKGESRGKTYRLGDRVYVRVANVSLEKREIDFSLLKKSL